MTTTSTTSTRGRKRRYVELDPNEVQVHPNVRHDLGDTRSLTRSVAELGVIVPVGLIVDPDGDGYLLVHGQRRRRAAIDAGEVLPGVVGHDIDDATRISQQLAENLHRKGLTLAEEAAAYEQLAVDFGMSNTAIAQSTGVTRQHVSKARKVASSEVATTVADRYDLTLDQAITLSEFDDDREAIKALTVTARQDPAQFDHVASRIRYERELAAQMAEAVEHWTDAGYTIIERTSDYPDAARIDSLTDSDDGQPISAEAINECPDRAVVLPAWDPSRAELYCLDPTANGYRDRFRANGQPKVPMTEEQKAERRTVIDSNKAWRAAEPVRQEFIITLLSRKTPPKGTLRFIAERILARPERFGDGKNELVAELLGVEAPTGWGRTASAQHLDGLPDARLPLALLAQVAADAEQAMGTHTWRNRDSEAAGWLAWLASVGYTLAEIEQHVVTTAHGTIEGTDDEPADEDAADDEAVVEDEPEEVDTAKAA